MFGGVGAQVEEARGSEALLGVDEDSGMDNISEAPLDIEAEDYLNRPRTTLRMAEDAEPGVPAEEMAPLPSREELLGMPIRLCHVLTV